MPRVTRPSAAATQLFELRTATLQLPTQSDVLRASSLVPRLHGKLATLATEKAKEKNINTEMDLLDFYESPALKTPHSLFSLLTLGINSQKHSALLQNYTSKYSTPCLTMQCHLYLTTITAIYRIQQEKHDAIRAYAWESENLLTLFGTARKPLSKFDNRLIVKEYPRPNVDLHNPALQKRR